MRHGDHHNPRIMEIMAISDGSEAGKGNRVPAECVLTMNPALFIRCAAGDYAQSCFSRIIFKYCYALCCKFA